MVSSCIAGHFLKVKATELQVRLVKSSVLFLKERHRDFKRQLARGTGHEHENL